MIQPKEKVAYTKEQFEQIANYFKTRNMYECYLIHIMSGLQGLHNRTILNMKYGHLFKSIETLEVSSRAFLIDPKFRVIEVFYPKQIENYLDWWIAAKGKEISTREDKDLIFTISMDYYNRQIKRVAYILGFENVNAYSAYKYYWNNIKITKEQL